MVQAYLHYAVLCLPSLRRILNSVHQFNTVEVAGILGIYAFLYTFISMSANAGSILRYRIHFLCDIIGMQNPFIWVVGTWF